MRQLRAQRPLQHLLGQLGEQTTLPQDVFGLLVMFRQPLIDHRHLHHFAFTPCLLCFGPVLFIPYL